MFFSNVNIIESLWAHTWQLTALILVVSLVVRLTAQNRPHLACILWLVVVLKCLTPPIWSSPSSVFSWLSPTRQTDLRFSTTIPDGLIGPLDQSAHPIQWDPNSPQSQESGPIYWSQTGEYRSPDRFRTPFDRQQSGSSRRFQDGSASRFVLVAWMLGTTLMLGIGGIRLVCCYWEIKKHPHYGDQSLDMVVASLSRKLKIRRRVRVLITETRIGPAVIGLFRPTILLPASLVRRKGACDLVPIIAHELVHVRRGDLWVGLLQVLAQSMWWFHPLVWLSTRLASRETERCCDEEVIAELDCDPAQYARSLLDVLQLKQTLKSVPAFPGVRPVQVTSKRLERIMKLGHGSLKRTPMWCWLILITAAITTLPGAAFVANATNGQDSAKPGTSQDDLLTVHYKAQSLLAKLISQGLTEDQSRQLLTNRVTSSRQSRIEWVGDSMVIRESKARHIQIKNVLDSMRQFGSEEVVAQTTMVTGSPEIIEALIDQWESIPSRAIPKSDLTTTPGRPLPPPNSKPASNVTVTIQRSTPLKCRLMDSTEAFRFLAQLQSSPEANVMAAPKMTLSNGRSAWLETSTQRSFIVGNQKDNNGRTTPEYKVVAEGMKIHFRPVLRGNDQVWLDCELILSDIQSITTSKPTDRKQKRQATVTTTVRVPDGGSVLLGSVKSASQSIAGKMPTVATTRIETSTEMTLGKTLVIGGLRQTNPNGSEESVLMMVHVTRPNRTEPAEKQNTAKQLFGVGVDSDSGLIGSIILDPAANSAVSELRTRTYNVSDLIVLTPDVVKVPPGPKSSDAQVDFAPLIELITETVQPDSWANAGGEGLIHEFKDSLSLIISQRKEIHGEIATLLGLVRRLRELQIALEVEVIELDSQLLEKLGLEFDPKKNPSSLESASLSLRETTFFRHVIGGSTKATVLRAPRVTLFNGQTGDISFGGLDPELSLKLVPVFKSEERMIWLECSIDTKKLSTKLSTQNSLLLRLDPDGATLEGTSPKQSFVLITPQVVKQDKENMPDLLDAPKQLRPQD